MPSGITFQHIQPAHLFLVGPDHGDGGKIIAQMQHALDQALRMQVAVAAAIAEFSQAALQPIGHGRLGHGAKIAIARNVKIERPRGRGYAEDDRG